MPQRLVTVPPPPLRERTKGRRQNKTHDEHGTTAGNPLINRAPTVPPPSGPPILVVHTVGMEILILGRRP